MRKKNSVPEKVAEFIFLGFASASVVSLIFITIFIFREGLPLFRDIDPLCGFLLNTNWEPTSNEPSFGILAFIIGSLYVTLAALLIAVPVGIGVGIFMAELAKHQAARLIRSGVELLAGIPSIIYGLFGVFFIAPLLRRFLGSATGLGVLNAALILAVMILPTIISITDVSLRAVPREIREGSLALGATQWQSIIHTLVPAARSGIIAGIVLGIGRAAGETMAVLMVAGNSPIMPRGPLSHTRTLTMNIITDLKYAVVGSRHETSLFSTGIVLFIFIMLINLLVQIILKRAVYRGRSQ